MSAACDSVSASGLLPSNEHNSQLGYIIINIQFLVHCMQSAIASQYYVGTRALFSSGSFLQLPTYADPVAASTSQMSPAHLHCQRLALYHTNHTTTARYAHNLAVAALNHESKKNIYSLCLQKKMQFLFFDKSNSYIYSHQLKTVRL